MGYYAMRLSLESRKVMRLNMIWGIYECLVLAMGVSPATDIFQRRVMSRMSDVKPKPPKVYLNDILTALKHTFKEHMEYLDEILTRVEEAGLQKEGYHHLALQLQEILDVAPCRDRKD
eukprot:1072669-Ditylum_brightwellii.AAC.1